MSSRVVARDRQCGDVGERTSWLTSQFLATPEGATAKGELERLGDSVREEVLSAGDRLAGKSVALAQRYYLRAAEAWDAFGVEGFLHWVHLGERLAVGEPACRDGALAYFAVSPASFGPRGLDTAAAWCQLGDKLLQVSRKLAGIFFETTAPILGRADGMERLGAWVEVALALYGEHGWRGEFLAQAFLSATPGAVVGLHPVAYRLWAGVGAALYSSVKQCDVFGALPPGLAHWTDTEQMLFLRATLAIAAVGNVRAHTFYREIPPAVANLSSGEREALLRVLATAGKHATDIVPEFAPVTGALVRQVPPLHRVEALRLVESVATRFPEAATGALRSLPRVYEGVSAACARRWFERGVEVATENGPAGLAYFALESRTSLRILYAGSTAAELEEEQGVLRKYIQMLSGDPVSLYGFDRFRLLLPLEEFPEEHEMGLPLRVDLFETHEDNFRLYRFAAAQIAGRREFGTYAFVPADKVGSSDTSTGAALSRYLADPRQPELLEPLFRLTEGFRVQCRLSAAYRGVATDGWWVGTRLLQRWAEERPEGQAMTVDALFAFLLAGVDWCERPFWLPHESAVLLLRSTAPLAGSAATVQDSMRVAHELAVALQSVSFGSVIREVQGGYVVPDDLTEDVRLLADFEDESGQSLAAGELPMTPAGGGDGEHADAADRLRLELDQAAGDRRGGSWPIAVEDLRRLLESGAKLEIEQAAGNDLDALGFYIRDLVGKVPAEELQRLRGLLGESDVAPRRRPRRGFEDSGKGEFFYYDEWDYHIDDYRAGWCRLREVSLDGDSGQFFNRTLVDYSSLIPEVRRQFQRIRPERYRTVRGLEDGEDFDLNAAIEARVELRARRTPSGKLYVARQREERDVATLFLIDMSASTDEPLECELDSPGSDSSVGTLPGRGPVLPARRIVDVTKEALVVMAAALEEIGDTFAIYGFSGHGRHNVEFYRVKAFAEPLNSPVKGRIGEIQPKRSTRMGAALRHAVAKMATVNARCKHLILLSDGFPQDHDYGQDRRSNTYGIRDTAVALQETESAGIRPFCITVDKAGHDYLRHMCDESRYMVIGDVAALPQELPKIYQRVVRG